MTPLNHPECWHLLFGEEIGTHHGHDGGTEEQEQSPQSHQWLAIRRCTLGGVDAIFQLMKNARFLLY